MIEITRDDLANADAPEAQHHLLEHGITANVWHAGGALHIAAETTEEALTAALVGYVPKASPGTWRPPIPAALAEHMPHVKAFFGAQRSGAQAAKPIGVRVAEAEHVIADLALVVRELYARLELE